MIIDDEYKSRTSDIVLTIYRVGLETVSAGCKNEFCHEREDDMPRAVFELLYAFTGINRRTGAPLNITKNMMINN